MNEGEPDIEILQQKLKFTDNREKLHLYGDKRRLLLQAWDLVAVLWVKTVFFSATAWSCQTTRARCSTAKLSQIARVNWPRLPQDEIQDLGADFWRRFLAKLCWWEEIVKKISPSQKIPPATQPVCSTLTMPWCFNRLPPKTPVPRVASWPFRERFSPKELAQILPNFVRMICAMHRTRSLI